MPQVRRVLGACSIETAQRKRVCHRDRKRHAIERGTDCLVIRDPVSGSSKNVFQMGLCGLFRLPGTASGCGGDPAGHDADHGHLTIASAVAGRRS
jgi:hypothetical protein